jgi:hypothetical protein
MAASPKTVCKYCKKALRPGSDWAGQRHKNCGRGGPSTDVDAAQIAEEVKKGFEDEDKADRKNLLIRSEALMEEYGQRTCYGWIDAEEYARALKLKEESEQLSKEYYKGEILL